jgi:hypothetical protein
MHEDCDPRILNYACMLMDRQKEGPAATEKCWLCETGKHHPELCGQLALYDLNTNKPLPQHLRAFALPNLHPEVLTNFPLYYYTGAMVLDAEKNADLQAFAPPMPAHGEEPWERLPADIARLAGGIWRKIYTPAESLRFAYNQERKRQKLPIPVPLSGANATPVNRPATIPPPLRPRGQPSRPGGQPLAPRGQQFGRGQPFAPRGQAFAPRGQPSRSRGQTRNYSARGW